MAVLMTVELANKLIDHYEKCIAKVSTCNHLKAALWLVKYFNVDYGICKCSVSVFYLYLEPCGYIASKLPDHRKYVYPLPITAKNKTEVLDRLQYRVDLLKSFIQHPPALP